MKDASNTFYACFTYFCSSNSNELENC